MKNTRRIEMNKKLKTENQRRMKRLAKLMKRDHTHAHEDTQNPFSFSWSTSNVT